MSRIFFNESDAVCWFCDDCFVCIWDILLLPVRGPGAESSRKREYFKAELERLRTSLKEDQAKIKTPPP